jgi:predicted NBD/HSP70 family sugar kinase
MVNRPGTPSLLRELNDQAALDLLLAGEPLTRAQISEHTGLSKVTVSQMLSRLEERGLVSVTGLQAGGRGPSAALYSVVPSSAYVAGLSLEADSVGIGISDVTGRVVAEVSADPRGADPSGVTNPIEVIRGAVDTVCRTAGVGLSRLTTFVIGSPGVVDPNTGDPRVAVNLPDWHEGVLEALRGALHLPVVIENDVNLAAIAEGAAGAARGVDDFVLVWMGGGLGLATVLGGRVHKGFAGAAGEIGYLPVPGAALAEDNGLPLSGGFHALVSAGAVRTLAGTFGFGAAGAGDAIRASIAVEQATASVVGVAGDVRAPGGGASGGGALGQEFLDELGRRVAIGVASVCAVLDPELVLLGGEVGHAGGAALADRVAAEVARICPAKPRVVAASVTGNPVLRGAILAALAQARETLRASVA